MSIHPTLGVVVIGHGGLATGLLDAVTLVMGEVKGVRALTLDEAESPDDLGTRVSAAVAEVGADGGLLLVDLPGATPFNVSARLVDEREDLELVAGVNLPMLLEVLVAREGSTPAEAAAAAVRGGTEGVVRLSTALGRHRSG